MSSVSVKPLIIDFGTQSESVTVKVTASIDVTRIVVTVPDWVDLGGMTSGTYLNLSTSGVVKYGQFTVTPKSGVLKEISPEQIEISAIDATLAEVAQTETQIMFSYDVEMTSVDEIIDDMMTQMTDDDFLKPTRKHQLMSIATRGIRMFSFDGMQKERLVEFKLDDSGRIDKPFDMVKLLRVFYVDQNGYLVPIYKNRHLNRSWGDKQDENGYLITDQNGYILQQQGLVTQPSKASEPYSNTLTTILSDYYRLDDYRRGGLYGIQGGTESYSGKYMIDEVGNQIILADVPSDDIVIEYMSDPVLLHNSGLSMGKLRVHKFYREAIEAYIYFNAIKRRRNVPMNEKQRAEIEYYNELRKARRRFVNMDEVYQALKKRFKFIKY